MRRGTRSSNDNVTGDNPNPDRQPLSEPLPPDWMKRGGYVEADQKDKNGHTLYRVPQPCEACRGRGDRPECLAPSLRPLSIKGLAPGFFHSVRCTACSGGGYRCSLSTRREKWAWWWDPTAGEAGEYIRARLPKVALDHRAYHRTNVREYRARVQKNTWRHSGGEHEQEPVATPDDDHTEDEGNTSALYEETEVELPDDDSTTQPSNDASSSQSATLLPTGGAVQETDDPKLRRNQFPDVIELLDSSDDDDGQDVNWSATPLRTRALKHRHDSATRPSNIKRPRFALGGPSNIDPPGNPSNDPSSVKHLQNETPNPDRPTGEPLGSIAPIPTTDGANTFSVTPSSHTQHTIEVTGIKVEHTPIHAERYELIEERNGIQTRLQTITPPFALARAASTSTASPTVINLAEKVKQLEVELKSTKAKLESTTAELAATREECEEVAKERDNLLEMYRNTLRKGKGRRDW